LRERVEGRQKREREGEWERKGRELKGMGRDLREQCRTAFYAPVLAPV